MEFSTATLNRALELARRGEGHTRPNPPVGAMLFTDRGKCIGEGCHHRAGENHAEVEAIADWQRRFPKCRPDTLLVTLEPCSKPGRVGACTDAIIRSGIKHVTYLCTDPNPKNRNRARKVLAACGISCDHLPCIEAEELIKPFAKRVKTGLPYVTVKLAMTLDGKFADNWGDGKWISSEESRVVTGRLRERVDAIMVGAETVRKDDPSLLSHGKPNPDLVRVVVSRSGKLPKKAQVFADGQNQTLVFDDPRVALTELGKAGFNHVLCEGGAGLATSLVEQGLVDEWLTVLCPKVIGNRHIRDAALLGAGKLKDLHICLRA